MKNASTGLALLLMLSAFSFDLFSQTAATRTTNAGASMVVAMTLSETAPLHFGTSTLTSVQGGTVVLPSNSAVLTYSGGLAASNATPIASNATYLVTGSALESYSLTLPASIVIEHSTANSGVVSMTIVDLKARFSGAGADAVTSTLSASGSDSFTLGGTLQVAQNQVAGVYAGTFSVTVDYN